MEREKIVERTQRGKLTRVQSGKMLGQGVAAYGYEWADEKKTAYVINLVEAEIVRKLFDMIANGCSLHGLTRYLHTNSIPSPEGKAFWRKGTISRLLRNPYYIGKARAYKHTYIPRPGKSALRAERPEEEQIEMPEGVVPAIVSVETFEKVQRQLQINKERSTRNNRNPEATLLRGGIAVCGYCNGNLIVHRDTTRGKDEAYYRCQKSVHDADWHPEFGISTKTLDDAVWRRVVEVIRNPELVARTVEAQRKKDPTEAELEPINRRLQDLARKRKNYLRISESVQDDDTLDEISKQLNALDKEKRDTEHERDILLNRRSNWQGTEKRLEDFRLWCADMVEKLDNVSYDEKYRACEILGMKAVVWRRDHTPRYEITATPPEIMSHVTCNVKLNLLPLLTWND
jgi:site-specific DNA recombinase